MEKDKKGLISVVTPCYNAAGYLHRLMDSILGQTYPNVEMIAVDDGSTDETLQILEDYIPKFEKKGYSLAVMHQSNQGQSSAICAALPRVKGEFLIWPDSDDFYRREDAFELFVNRFRSLPDEYGVVRCMPVYRDEDSEEERSYDRSHVAMGPYLFYNCLYCDRFVWGAGNYMVRMQAFDKVNKDRSIYVEKNAGQNWQMLLPLLYSYQCDTIEEECLCVLERKNSHSRGQYQGYEQLALRVDSYCNTIVHTLDSMNTISGEERKSLLDKIKAKYLYEKFRLAIGCQEKKHIWRLFKLCNSRKVKVAKKDAIKMILVLSGMYDIALCLRRCFQ